MTGVAVRHSICRFAPPLFRSPCGRRENLVLASDRPLRMRYSPDKKNPIQPRNWIGQVRHAPRKAPLEEKRMLTFAAFRSSLRPYTTFQSTSFYAALRVASHCGAEFHLALQSQGLLRHQRGTKHAREQDRQRHQRRDNVQGILVRTGGLPHAGKQHGTT